MRNRIGAPIRLRRRQEAQLRIGACSVVLRTKDAERDHRLVQESDLAMVGSVAGACIAAHPDLAIDVRLSCAWSRMLILPAIEQLTSEERWRNYARARFDQVYGEGGDGWDVRIARNWPGQDRVAVAWPTALREQLAAHPNVRSVRVSLLEHLTIVLAQEPMFSGCLVQIEPGGAGVLLLLTGRLRRSRWCRFEDAEGLSAAVCAEWASVLIAATATARDLTLVLAPPFPPAESDQARAVNLLATSMGISRGFSLPEWS